LLEDLFELLICCCFASELISEGYLSLQLYISRQPGVITEAAGGPPRILIDDRGISERRRKDRGAEEAPHAVSGGGPGALPIGWSSR